MASADADKDTARAAFAELRAALSAGTVRAAEPDSSSPIGWRVNAWVKQGILLGFRFGDLVDASMDHGRLPFYDKDTLPLKRPGLDARRPDRAGRIGDPRWRVSRAGRHLHAADVREHRRLGRSRQSLIDSHALIGSCAQIGARVHVSAGAQIGGVIEPVGALPVIVEDEALIGGNTGVYEGVVIKTRAVIGAGTVLTGSTPVYDLVKGEVIRPTRRASAGRAGRRRGRAGCARGDRWKRPGVGAVAGHAGHREVPRLADGHADGARSVDQVVDLVALTRALIDIDSTTGREAAAGRWLADYLRSIGFTVTEQPVDAGRFNVFAGPANAQVVLSTHFDCVPPFFPSRLDGGRIVGRGSCDAKGILAAQVAAVDRLRRSGEDARRRCCSSSARSEAATAPARRTSRRHGSRFLIDGEPTDNRLALATRGALRLRLVASGRAAHSSFPELGDSAIDKLIDALVELRSIALPSDPDLGRTHYTIGLISGGVAPNVVSPAAEAEVMFRTVSDARTVRDGVDVPRIAGSNRAHPRSAPGPHDCGARLRQRGISVYDRHPVSRAHGAGRCSTGPDRSTWRTPPTNSSRSRSSKRPWTDMWRWRAICCLPRRSDFRPATLHDDAA